MSDKRQRCSAAEYIAGPDTTLFLVVLVILAYDGIFLARLLPRMIVQRLELIVDGKIDQRVTWISRLRMFMQITIFKNMIRN